MLYNLIKDYTLCEHRNPNPQDSCMTANTDHAKTLENILYELPKNYSLEPFIHSMYMHYSERSHAEIQEILKRYERDHDKVLNLLIRKYWFHEDVNLHLQDNSSKQKATTEGTKAPQCTETKENHTTITTESSAFTIESYELKIYGIGKQHWQYRPITQPMATSTASRCTTTTTDTRQHTKSDINDTMQPKPMKRTLQDSAMTIHTDAINKRYRLSSQTTKTTQPCNSADNYNIHHATMTDNDNEQCHHSPPHQGRTEQNKRKKARKERAARRKGLPTRKEIRARIYITS